MDIKQLDNDYILHSYGRVDVEIDSGKGSFAKGSNGKTYLDFTSGIGVNSLGYCPPNWVEAVQNQAAKLQHISNYYYNQSYMSFAKNLAEATGMARSFFCNSGAEANECAIKIARKTGEAKGKYKIITLIDSFHGRTITTLSATGQEVFHKEFLPMTEGFTYVEGNNIEALKNAIDDKTCAIMLESVQGEGGVVPMDEDYIKAVRSLCDDMDLCLVMDEVQTGAGRTGYFMAYEGFGVKPDVVTMAKGIGGGLPIGVCLVSEKLKDIFAPGMNGSTFGGNPIVCAGANEIVNTINNPTFLEEVRAKGKYFWDKLTAMDKVQFVRGKGLMLGIMINGKTNKEVLLACAEKGLLILTAKDLVRFLPPLNISYEEIDQGLKIFEEVINS